MNTLQKWQKKYSELNTEFLSTKEMMTEREIYEVKSHLKSISSFIEDIQAFQQPLNFQKVNKMIQDISLETFIACGGNKSEWKEWWSKRNAVNLNIVGINKKVD